ncbi:hypothetical protein RCL1_001609 [Eukaryota sp. TZLM3-RCL]
MPPKSHNTRKTLPSTICPPKVGETLSSPATDTSTTRSVTDFSTQDTADSSSVDVSNCCIVSSSLYTRLLEFVDPLLQSDGSISTQSFNEISTALAFIWPVDQSEFKKKFPLDSVFFFSNDSLSYSLNGTTIQIELSPSNSPRARSSSDPLLGLSYIESSRDIKFQSAVESLLTVISVKKQFLKKFHSPILPVINSTGLGKTRLLLNNLGKSISSYFCFPRYTTSVAHGFSKVPTWPATVDWETFKFNPSATLVQAVFHYQCLLTALLDDRTFDHPECIDFDTFDFETHFLKIINKTLFLYKRNKHNFEKEISLSATKNMLANIRKRESYVLALDEVGTLLSKSVGNSVNHFIILRYAARNLLAAGVHLLVIVAGTNLSLNSFVSDPIQQNFYRRENDRSHLIARIQSGATVPPFLDVFHVMDPKAIFSTNPDVLDINVAPLLSLNQCIAARPLWTAYALQIFKSRDVDELVDYVIQSIIRKVDSGLRSGPLEDVASNALHCILGQSGTIPLNLIAESVEHQFTIIRSSSQVEEGPFLFSTMVLIDPVIMAECWATIVKQTKDNDDMFKLLLHSNFLVLLSNHIIPHFLGLLLEPLVCSYLVFLLRNKSVNIGVNDDAALVREILHHVPVGNLLDHCSKYKLKRQEEGNYRSEVLSNWSTTALHPVPFPIESCTSTDTFFEILLYGLVNRIMFLMPPGFTGIDAIIPIIKLPSFGTSDVKVNEIIHEQVGYIRVQIKNVCNLRNVADVFNKMREPLSTLFDEDQFFSLSLLVNCNSSSSLDATQLSPRNISENTHCYSLHLSSFSDISNLIKDQENQSIDQFSAQYPVVSPDTDMVTTDITSCSSHIRRSRKSRSSKSNLPPNLSPVAKRTRKSSTS